MHGYKSVKDPDMSHHTQITYRIEIFSPARETEFPRKVRRIANDLDSDRKRNGSHGGSILPDQIPNPHWERSKKRSLLDL